MSLRRHSQYRLSNYASIIPAEDDRIFLVSSLYGTSLALSGLTCSGNTRDALLRSELPEEIHNLLRRTGLITLLSDEEERKLMRRFVADQADRAPFELILLPHENCNFRCEYCYESFARNLMRPEVVEAVKLFLARNIKQWSGLKIGWFGGEPLLGFRVLENVMLAARELCKQAEIRLFSDITTNGFLLDQHRFHRLLQLEVSDFQITLDGPPEIHDKKRRHIKGVSSYFRILENLRYMASTSEQFCCIIRVNFDRENFEPIKNWLPQMAEAFGEDARFELSFHDIWGMHCPVEQLFDAASVHSARTELQSTAVACGWKFSKATSLDSYKPSGSVCYAAKRNSFIVGSDGSVYKCTVALDDPINKIGTISSAGTLELDAELHSRWTEVDFSKTPKCSSCWFAPSCQGRSCPLNTIKSAGVPDCPSVKFQPDFDLTSL